jgi:beta-phosphoglucomutase-like phosphatase (HAD superfamily)
LNKETNKNVGSKINVFKKDLRMEISDQLMRPFINRIETEWRDLYREISDHTSEEANVLKPSIEQRMRQIERFRVSALYFEKDDTGLKEFPNLREALRFLKLDLRTARRKWRRYLVSKVRTQKRQERAEHGVSFAA